MPPRPNPEYVTRGYSSILTSSLWVGKKTVFTPFMVILGFLHPAFQGVVSEKLKAPILLKAVRFLKHPKASSVHLLVDFSTLHHLHTFFGAAGFAAEAFDLPRRLKLS